VSHSPAAARELKIFVSSVYTVGARATKPDARGVESSVPIPAGIKLFVKTTLWKRFITHQQLKQLYKNERGDPGRPLSFLCSLRSLALNLSHLRDSRSSPPSAALREAVKFSRVIFNDFFMLRGGDTATFFQTRKRVQFRGRIGVTVIGADHQGVFAHAGSD
jgi:hypothetical protein